MIRNTALFIALRRMRFPLLMLIAAYAVSILGLVLMPGSDAEGRPHHLDFFHAFYVISYTATTIGFGEVPYPYSDAQRLWVIASIYLCVVAWLYAVGTLIALLQDPAFRQVLREARFVGSVRRIVGPFHIVCGFGDTGALLVRTMVDRGLGATVIDPNQERLNELSLENLPIYVPSLCADAGQPGNLLLAGLKHPMCAGVVSVTARDQVNLKVAITGKLLNPGLRVISRAQSHDMQANMASFGTDATINHFDTFADRLAMALHSPDMYLVYEWLTEAPGRALPLRINPPRGTWVLCGYGRFGKAVRRYLDFEGVPTVIVEATPEIVNAPKGTIVGRGTEAVTLREAHIEKAVGIVAGTDDDANNLSIIMTARELNKNLFLVARQNQTENDAIFQAAGLDLVMQRSRIIANRIMALMETPLLTEFLHHARHRSNEWAKDLIERMWPIIGNHVPQRWSVHVSPTGAPALHEAVAEGRKIRVRHLLQDPGDRRERLAGLSLLLQRRGEDAQLLPDEDTLLRMDDQLLMCGRPTAAGKMGGILNNRNLLRYVVSGEVRPEGTLWRWLARRSNRSTT